MSLEVCVFEAPLKKVVFSWMIFPLVIEDFSDDKSVFFTIGRGKVLTGDFFGTVDNNVAVDSD